MPIDNVERTMLIDLNRKGRRIVRGFAGYDHAIVEDGALVRSAPSSVVHNLVISGFLRRMPKSLDYGLSRSGRSIAERSLEGR